MPEEEDDSVVGIRWRISEVYDESLRNTVILSEEYNECVRVYESV